MPRSLKNDLGTLRKKERLSLHMPGHKGLRIREDVTELELTDNLLNPKGGILELEKAIAKIYGGKNCYLGTNGSTSLLLGSLFLVGEKKKVVLPRISHQSIYKGIINNNQEPIYIKNEIDDLGIGKLVKNEDYLKTLDMEGDAYIFTTPSYEGFINDYTMLKPFLKDKTTIIDSAHGSHLYYIKKDDNNWADLKILSFHKTLGALNQGAGIISNIEEDIRENINFYQTSSPSFPILLSIEDSIREMMKMKVSEKLRYINWLKEEIGNISRLEVVENDDPFKLLIAGDNIDLKKLGAFLKDEYGIFFEIENPRYLLGILSFYDSLEDYKYLIKSLKNALKKHGKEIENREADTVRKELHIPKIDLLPGEAFRKEKKLVPLRESIGKVSGILYSKYPPGVPSLVPGEIIDEVVIEEILENKDDYTGCNEIADDMIFVIK